MRVCRECAMGRMGNRGGLDSEAGQCKSTRVYISCNKPETTERLQFPCTCNKLKQTYILSLQQTETQFPPQWQPHSNHIVQSSIKLLNEYILMYCHWGGFQHVQYTYPNVVLTEWFLPDDVAPRNLKCRGLHWRRCLVWVCEAGAPRVASGEG
jgi:hypothetical protein